MPRQPKIKRKGHAEFLAGVDLATTPYKQLVKLAKRAKLDSKGKSEVLRAALTAFAAGPEPEWHAEAEAKRLRGPTVVEVTYNQRTVKLRVGQRLELHGALARDICYTARLKVDSSRPEGCLVETERKVRPPAYSEAQQLRFTLKTGGQWRGGWEHNQHLNVFTAQRPGMATIERLHSRGRWEELKVKWPPLKVEILHDDD